MMKSAFSVLALVLTEIGCGAATSPTSAPPSGSALDADWLDGTMSIDKERIDRLFSLAIHDPEVKPLVDEAVAKLGRGSLAAVYAKVSVCARDDAPGLAGKTFMRQETVVIAHGDGWEAEAAAKTSGDDVMAARKTDALDYTTIERWIVPHLCLQPAMPVRAAYEALVHELTHALRRDPRAQPFDLAAPADEGRFAIALVQLPGDEVDAYSTAARARARVDGGTAGLLPPIRGVFDEQGRLVASREALARAIVASQPGGLGYGDGMLRAARATSRATEARTIESKRRLLGTYADLRHAEQTTLAKNVEIVAGNAAIREKNVAIAQQRGDRAMEAKFRAELEDDRRTLAETRSRLAASQATEQRVRAEIPALEARIAALSTR